MYLVDTSVWIDFIRGNKTNSVEYLHQLLITKQRVGINSVIFQEILQGAESENHFEEFHCYFSELPFYQPKHSTETYAKAAHIYFNCRRKGFTIRSTIDCLIAQTAIEHGLTLLHSDKDFQNIAKITPTLKLYNS